MITVKQAAEYAAQYLAQLVPLNGAPLVEEVSQDGDDWYITLSYSPTHPSGNAFLTLTTNRQFKTFHINGNDGQVISMKIRSVKE